MTSFFRNFSPQATLAIVMALVLGFVTLAVFGPTAGLALIAMTIVVLLIVGMSILRRTSAATIVNRNVVTDLGRRRSTIPTGSARSMDDKFYSKGGSGENNGMTRRLTEVVMRAWDTATSWVKTAIGDTGRPATLAT